MRVVHGGDRFTGPTEITADVSREITDLRKWAPLHKEYDTDPRARLAMHMFSYRF